MPPRVASALPSVKDRPPAYRLRYRLMDETQGERIRKLREAKGLSQTQLARMIDERLGNSTQLSKATVSKWETDQTTFIREIHTLAEVLGTDVAYLRWGPDRAPRPPRAPSSPSPKKRNPDGGSSV